MAVQGGNAQLAALRAQLAAQTEARVALEAEIVELKGGSLQSASMPMPPPSPMDEIPISELPDFFPMPPLPPKPPSMPLPPTVQTDAAAADRPSMPLPLYQRGKICESCHKTRASYGLPTDGKRRWCAPCGRKQEGAEDVNH